MSGLLLTSLHLAGFVFYLAGALACVACAAWLLRKGDAARPDRVPTILALAIAAIWCVIVAANGPGGELAGLTRTVMHLAFLHVLYRLFAADGRHESLRLIRPVIGALVFVECLQPVLLMMASHIALKAELALIVFQLQAMFNILVAIGVLVLLHNLYVGASLATRAALRWSAVTLAAIWGYELNLYTIAYLADGLPGELLALRGLVLAFAAGGLALGLSGAREHIRLRPSRTVAFQSLSLLVIGGYLLVMVGIALSLDLLGAGFGRLTQVTFLFFALLAALYWMPSARMRGSLRVILTKHLFQHRYDYRAEWLRFTQTIGRTGAGPFGERVVRAMADMTESPAGLLLLPEDDGSLTLAARWNWPSDVVFPAAIPADLASLMERENFIVDLDSARRGIDHRGELALMPPWLAQAETAWVVVPLLHFERLTGAVILARPAHARQIDWEDLDLLRIAGQQLASYIAEQNVQQTLMEAARFDEFNRRMAFVMHDIKNLASQLGLLARNAEKHADNPAFRADMLVTLRNSSDKLTSLLTRLGRYGSTGKDKRARVDLSALCARLVAEKAAQHPVELLAEPDIVVDADVHACEQAVGHILQNAIEASASTATVFVEVARMNGMAVIQVVDAGEGMSPEFVRNGLFKPFVSSKTNGFGIGAFEARELVRAQGGRLEVDSREGLGSRFAIRLPLATTTALLEADQSTTEHAGAA